MPEDASEELLMPNEANEMLMPRGSEESQPHFRRIEELLRDDADDDQDENTIDEDDTGPAAHKLYF